MYVGSLLLVLLLLSCAPQDEPAVGAPVDELIIDPGDLMRIEEMTGEEAQAYLVELWRAGVQKRKANSQ